MDSKYSGCFLNDGLDDAVACDRLMQRRLAYMAQCPGITVISGLSEHPFRLLEGYHFHSLVFQDPDLLYLTGMNQAPMILLMDGHDAEVELYIAPKNRRTEFWEGVQFGAGDPEDCAVIAAVSGVRQVFSIAEFWDRFLARLQRRGVDTVWTSFLRSSAGKWKKDYRYQWTQRLKRRFSREGMSIEIQSSAHTLQSMRNVLDSVDVAHAEEANRCAEQVFREVLSQGPFSTEYALMACIESEARKSSPFGLSFHPIIASGANAQILHYAKNNDSIDPDGLVLLDFGVRSHAMVSDISRTIPANGRFNPLQRLLYEIVLDAQLKVEDAARAGVTISALNTVCWDSIQSDLDRRIIAKGGTVTLPYEQSPHNVSHWMGIRVHEGDPFRGYRDQPLVEGQLISNEPGLYGQFLLEIEGVLYSESCGIRIEDDLLIEAKGVRNLSSAIPKSIEALEAGGSQP